MKSSNEIHLRGGYLSHRVIIYCLYQNNSWSFLEIPYDFWQQSHDKSDVMKIAKDVDFKEAVSSIIADTIFNIGNESIKK